MNLNKWVGIGRLTRDPEVRVVGGKNVAKFGLAVNRRYKKDEEWVDDTMFIDCELWDTGADRLVEHFKKGDLILIDDGQIRLDTWEDKTTGQRRQKHYVRVNHFQSFFHLLKKAPELPPGEGPVAATATAAKGKAKAKAKPEPAAEPPPPDMDADESVPF